ncbi:unnamed protein product [Kuraishia capsulata CBS 1993]|uniref:Transcriptional protein SWT1 n=1 Tax=Kuraishia capsulata CBS 1993 TaxID=1382522 RepID=W6MWH7_9ASCO|nr:uncharacterized protein KUCA_T00003443001 [Kuraishia capsulata CBS 1993]CDK27465.1 unnamed protein product [Kuraishia capsulata CBS 1993]
MSELPSIHSSAGLSIGDKKKVLTVGHQKSNRPVGVVPLDSLSFEPESRQQDYNIEPMDISMEISVDEPDYTVENDAITEILKTVQHSGSSNLPIEEPSDTVFDDKARLTFLVVDTNFVLSNLSIIVDLRSLSASYKTAYRIIIPSTVIQELDGLKSSQKHQTFVGPDGASKDKPLGTLARWAIDWIYLNFQRSDPVVLGQKLHQKIDPMLVKDDAILDCCLYFQKKYTDSLVVLMSNDKNLCVKALTNDVLTISYRKDMSAGLIAEKVIEEHRSRHPEFGDELDDAVLDDTDVDGDIKFDDLTELEVPSNPSVTATIHDPVSAGQTIYNHVLSLLMESIDKKLHEEFGDEIELLDYSKSNVATLYACFKTLKRFSFTGFSDIIGPRGGDVGRIFGSKSIDPIYTNPPKTRPDIETFTALWIPILTKLYANRGEKQKHDLKELFRFWKTIM